MNKQKFGPLCWLVVVGCGGQVDPGSGSGAIGAGGADGAGGAWNSGYTQLGACTPGFELQDEPNRDCNWLAGNLCYDTKEAACACVCPVDHPATCMSGFYGGADSRTKVSCF